MEENKKERRKVRNNCLMVSWVFGKNASDLNRGRREDDYYSHKLINVTIYPIFIFCLSYSLYKMFTIG